MSAQELYDDFLSHKIYCSLCQVDVPFAEVQQWADPAGGASNVICPNCDTGYRIDDPVLLDKIKRLSDVDKRIAGKIVDAADAGKLPDKQSYKIAMIIKYHCIFKQHVVGNHPLSYVDRAAMRLVYNELITAGTIQPINIYEARAPIPISFERKRMSAPTFKGLGGSTKKRTKTKKLGLGMAGTSNKAKPSEKKLSFGFTTKPKPKD